VTERQVIPLLFLAAILALLAPGIQNRFRKALQRTPWLLFAGPAVLTGIFLAILWKESLLSGPLAGCIAAFTFLPSLLAYGQRQSAPGWFDLGIVVLLWFPLEFGAGAQWVPASLQGYLHTVAYGVSILLALWIFLLYRAIPGMKYRLPASYKDFAYPVAALLIVAPILISIGLYNGFLAPLHGSSLPAWKLATRFLIILAATALPEEILFRSLIQNLLMQKLGSRTSTLVLASLIFGLAHLNNGRGPGLNWRYAVLASVAGFAYGKVFQLGSSVFASMFLHAGVNTIRHAFF
jgi:membrane protease YdiL (CAAX protease family)